MLEKELNDTIAAQEARPKATIGEVEACLEQKKTLTFEEYIETREPSYKVLLRDFAVKAVEKAKAAGEELALEDAMQMARDTIPAAFVPEWMQNLRIAANISGTELCAFNEMIGELRGIREILEVVFRENIQFFADMMKSDLARAYEAKRASDKAYKEGWEDAMAKLSAENTNKDNTEETEG